MSAANSPLPDWAPVLGQPVVRGVLRADPEDFRVQELPSVEPEGEGGHLWLEVEKRNANTAWVAGRLAEAAGVPEREIGYAGLKDRHAVTTQWFSVGLQQARDDGWENWRIPDTRILRGVRHRRKLQRGALRGNRFRIRVRDLEGELDSIGERAERLARQGLANYFGPQRFGHGGANVARGLAWLEQGGRIRRSDRSLYLSAVRSDLFNRVLSERVRRGDWDRLLDGEVAMLDGSHSSFVCQLPDADLEHRCTEFDLHPTGPLPGRGGRARQPERAAAAVEASVLAPFAPAVSGLDRAGVEADRRSLRVPLRDLAAEISGRDLLLEFSLPAGAYATSLLRELVLTGPGTISDSS